MIAYWVGLAASRLPVYGHKTGPIEVHVECGVPRLSLSKPPPPILNRGANRSTLFLQTPKSRSPIKTTHRSHLFRYPIQHTTGRHRRDSKNRMV
jgi:hypothetical protein